MTPIKRSYFFISVCVLVCLQIGRAAQTPEISGAAKRLHADVQALTSIQPPRHYQNISSLDRAAEYIFKEFAKCTERVEYQVFKADGNEYKNVIAAFGPENGERLVVGAHYDVCGDQPGADDNASGTAAILELARLLSSLKPTLKHRVDLVAFTLEEPPFFRTPNMGSAVHAQSLKNAGVKVRLMISIDMIGYFSGDVAPHPRIAPYVKKGAVLPGLTTTVIGRKKEKKISRKLKKHMGKALAGSGLVIVTLNPPEGTPTIDWSDHLNYWNHGYPAVLVSNAFLTPNANYHSPRDTIDTLDFRKMAQLVGGVYYALLAL